MNIIKAKIEELDSIMELYKIAKEFMDANGNPNQWDEYYPTRDLIKQDIIKQQCYVIKEDDEIVAVFVFIIGEDETYQVIENGNWSSNKTYGTIHRIASSGKVKGIAKTCYDFCKDKIDYLRVDTHDDNKIMQKSLISNGFKKCGIIYVGDGTPRIAFDYLKEYPND